MDKRMPEQLRSHLEDLPGFRSSHWQEGLSLGSLYVDRAGTDLARVQQDGADLARAEQDRILLIWNMTLLIWLDDQLDAGPLPLGSHLLSSTPEAWASHEGLIRAFRPLEEALAQRCADPVELQLWRNATLATIRAWELEQSRAHTREPWSLLEYLENGVYSSAIPQILMTLSVLEGLELARRLHLPSYQQVVRQFALLCRLENDLFSLEKERLEKCRANAVLLLEETLPGPLAARVVQGELSGARRLLVQGLDEIRTDLGLCARIRSLVSAHEQWYLSHSKRYS